MYIGRHKRLLRIYYYLQPSRNRNVNTGITISQSCLSNKTCPICLVRDKQYTVHTKQHYTPTYNNSIYSNYKRTGREYKTADIYYSIKTIMRAYGIMQISTIKFNWFDFI